MIIISSDSRWVLLQDVCSAGLRFQEVNQVKNIQLDYLTQSDSLTEGSTTPVHFADLPQKTHWI